MRFLSRLLLILCGILLPCFLIEAGVRAERYFSRGTSIWTNPSSKWDRELGWLGKEHVIENKRNDHPILVLGDSFTEGMDLPSEEMWFSYLKEISKEQKIIAYGGRGYGTLQQLMMLKKYLSGGLKPSAIIIQLCTNDIINNSYELEKQSHIQRAPGPRPYLEDGKINIRFARNFDWALYPLVSISRVAAYYSMKWELKTAALANSRKINSIEFDIAKSGFALPAYRQAVSVTDALIGQIKETAGETPLHFVLVDEVEPYVAALKTTLDKKKLQLIIAPQIQKFLDSDRLEDGTHLNKEGNKKLGESVVKEMT